MCLIQAALAFSSTITAFVEIFRNSTSEDVLQVEFTMNLLVAVVMSFTSLFHYLNRREMLHLKILSVFIASIDAQPLDPREAVVTSLNERVRLNSSIVRHEQPYPNACRSKHDIERVSDIFTCKKHIVDFKGLLSAQSIAPFYLSAYEKYFHTKAENMFITSSVCMH